ncbi:hypothetical protein L1887_40019 [Cichorium endivia]|nr:hypothetical protein L1887_40019 [Cichorium endivia]
MCLKHKDSNHFLRELILKLVFNLHYRSLIQESPGTAQKGYFKLVRMPEVLSVDPESRLGVEGHAHAQDSNNDFHEILIAEAASLSERGIQVTPERNDKQESSRAGRAIYFSPFHLWNKTSGELASFSTSFSFVIDSNFSTQYGDGLTFFLAESKYQINGGGAMGLPFDIATNLMISQFVAVEFYTFPNGWDPVDSNTRAPIGDHVGINVNSLTSVSFLKWWSNITYGRECQAWIDYDSVSKILRVHRSAWVGDHEVRTHGGS